jgi:O-acetyl-ADP-ribose deacetylase (regulator of RNase III)
MSTAAARRFAIQRPIPWTNESVLAMASGRDPLEAVVLKARQSVFRAIEAGWSGPPYDPFALAEFLRIPVEPRQDVIDARTICTGEGKFRIEFNPDRSPARINFSVAHEIAHTLFPDCGEAIRNRYTHTEMKANDWELELLCNVAAAEILMPPGSFRPPEDGATSIDAIIELQRRFLVSTEAVLLRIAKLADQECFVFASHRHERDGSYRIDYAAASRAWPVAPRTGFRLPKDSAVTECTAIGYTAKRNEEWVPGRGRWRVECLGIAPFPEHTYPRVVGVVRPMNASAVHLDKIQYLRGDATAPRGDGSKIIVQVVNDKAIVWGRGFAAAVRKRWPHAQKDFTRWVLTSHSEFRAGQVRIVTVEGPLELASLVAQHGYGPSLFPRIQYSALEECLVKVAAHAKQANASVHMPRIGCGEAGGSWDIVSELIDETLCRNNIPVTVYDLPVGPRHSSRGRATGSLSRN